MTSRDDGYRGDILTDLALLQFRRRQQQLRILFMKPKVAIHHTSKAQPFAQDDDPFTRLLSKALDEKLAGKISGRQFKRIRERVNKGIRALPLAAD